MNKKHLMILLSGVIYLYIYAIAPKQTLSNFERYERYCDSIEHAIRGNYHLIQPGLFGILNRMPDSVGSIQINKDILPPTNAYPLIFSAKLSPNTLNNTDTLMFNWISDTIICKNSVFIDNSDSKCDLISSVDSMRIFYIIEDPFFTHGFVMDMRYKERYINMIKYWDSKMIDTVCIAWEQFPSTPCRICISRIIIKNGKLVDVKSKKCVDIEYEKLIDK